MDLWSLWRRLFQLRAHRGVSLFTATRLVRGRIAFEFSPSCAPQAPPGRAGRPPTHPYYPNARPYVGVWPISTTTRTTKIHTRTQFDAAGKNHAHNLSKSKLNCLMMLPMPLREDGVALLDHERRRKSCRPLPLRTPQCNVSWRGGGARGSDGRGRGPSRRRGWLTRVALGRRH